ncbi:MULTISPECIES: NAD(P)/FAD-dependent oxidoreductase [unclassified Anaeromyxobacter]|uniref:flavin monoamine oxidase family protein n=1 Tax=unclassified Anaeromyxobacter TaxID=2620896 RepID=UPI001F567A27|nr:MULTISPECIES: NAD(P)/FAD-dependent oxidoreductase [unclassified Anaeromyxobacter]
MAARRAPHVIVVGAGAAGLAAAALLRDRGVAVTLVEARDRYGGRIDTRLDPVLGLSLEHGAEFVHGHPDRTLALARRARAAIREVPDRHQRPRGSRLAGITAAYARAQELLALGTRDDESIGALLRRRSALRRSREAIPLARELVRGFYLADPRTASSLALARLSRGMEELGGDTAARIDGGYARILSPLARALRGGVLRLGTVVEEVGWGRREVRLRARGRAGGRLAPITGSHAIVTLPLSILRDGAVRFVPALPEKQSAARALAMGPVVKVLLRFRRAPWGGRRLVFLHVPGAAVPVFWTLAPVDAPVLVGWAGGPGAARLAGKREQDVLRAAIRSASHGLGLPPAELEDLLDGAAIADWTRDPFARGGYAVFPVGSDGASAALARSVEGTLFFAGEATAAGLAGTVEGALRSGERAAREVLETL